MQTITKPPNLFDWQDWPPDLQDTYPLAPGYKGERGGPGHQAAKAIAPSAKSLRGKVLTVIGEGQCLTADQIAVRLQRTPFSIRPRVAELFKLGLIERADGKGKNESGMTASRWQIAEADHE